MARARSHASSEVHAFVVRAVRARPLRAIAGPHIVQHIYGNMLINDATYVARRVRVDLRDAARTGGLATPKGMRCCTALHIGDWTQTPASHGAPASHRVTATVRHRFRPPAPFCVLDALLPRCLARRAAAT